MLNLAQLTRSQFPSGSDAARRSSVDRLEPSVGSARFVTVACRGTYRGHIHDVSARVKLLDAHGDIGALRAQLFAPRRRSVIHRHGQTCLQQGTSLFRTEAHVQGACGMRQRYRVTCSILDAIAAPIWPIPANPYLHRLACTSAYAPPALGSGQFVPMAAHLAAIFPLFQV